MQVFRVIKNGNYCVMSNYHLKDKKLSLAAKGLLSIILSLPDNWTFNINGLCSITDIKPYTIKKIIQELKDNQYLIVNKKNDTNGRFIYEYLVYECNSINPNYKENSPEYELPYLVAPQLVNDSLYKYTYNNLDKIDKTKLNLCFITEHLIDRNFIKVNDIELFGYDDYFRKLLDQHDVRDIYRTVTYSMNHMIKNKFKDEDGNEINNKLTYFISSVERNLKKLESFGEELWPSD
ncbi:MAG: hypothetical protein PHP12_04315 [Bacilli bacterium]|nr:hypothetical protein [Bacilli bacterium]